VEATASEFNLSVYDVKGEVLDKLNLNSAESVKSKQAITK
jgi:hypothetical protein